MNNLRLLLLQAPEVRFGLFQWFIDIRQNLKGRLPRKFLILKAQELYQEWLKQNPVEESKTIQFSTRWVHSWMEDFGVSLRRSNKRYTISFEDRVQRLEEIVMIVLRVRNYYIKLLEWIHLSAMATRCHCIYLNQAHKRHWIWKMKTPM